MKSQPILIIGNTGKTGSRVQSILDDRGYQTRGASRSSEYIFDWNDATTWSQVMQGVATAYVTYQPDLAVPHAEETMRNFVAQAKVSGLKHIVLLSGRGEEGAERAERVLQGSGLSWGIVRASWFAQNFSEGFMLDGILSGQMVLPSSQTREPFIDVDDIADVAVAALTQERCRNQLFEVTGPRAITFAECVQAISEATGRAIEYVPIPIDDYIEALKHLGQPEDIQWLMRELFTVVFDGRNTQTKNGVLEALGRPATDFKEYVKKTVQTGIWDVAA